MTSFVIDAVDVPRWAPDVCISEQVSPADLVDAFVYRAPARFTAPAISFSPPQPLYVAGGNFTILTEQSGVIPDSTYLAGEYAWLDLFHPARHMLAIGDRPTLIAGNSAWRNYWHWVFQCLAPVVLAGMAGWDRADLLVPQLTPGMRDLLALTDLESARIIELPHDGAAVAARGIYSNLTGGAFAFAPHPQLIAAFLQLTDRPPRSTFAGSKVFISRAGSPNRVMENEAALGERLTAQGFVTVAPDRLCGAEQVALFRDAAMIVAQHGAALTNLLFAPPGGDGPIVVELLQDNFLSPCFLKLCQVKRLRYAAIVGAMTEPGSDGRHLSRWTADIPLICRVVAGL